MIKISPKNLVKDLNRFSLLTCPGINKMKMAITVRIVLKINLPGFPNHRGNARNDK